MHLFDKELSLDDINNMDIPRLDALVNARIDAIKERNKALEEARKLEKRVKP